MSKEAKIVILQDKQTILDIIKRNSLNCTIWYKYQSSRLRETFVHGNLIRTEIIRGVLQCTELHKTDSYTQSEAQEFLNNVAQIDSISASTENPHRSLYVNPEAVSVQVSGGNTCVYLMNKQEDGTNFRFFARDYRHEIHTKSLDFEEYEKEFPEKYFQDSLMYHEEYKLFEDLNVLSKEINKIIKEIQYYE